MSSILLMSQTPSICALDFPFVALPTCSHTQSAAKSGQRSRHKGTANNGKDREKEVEMEREKEKDTEWKIVRGRRKKGPRLASSFVPVSASSGNPGATGKVEATTTAPLPAPKAAQIQEEKVSQMQDLAGRCVPNTNEQKRRAKLTCSVRRSPHPHHRRRRRHQHSLNQGHCRLGHQEGSPLLSRNPRSKCLGLQMSRRRPRARERHQRKPEALPSHHQFLLGRCRWGRFPHDPTLGCRAGRRRDVSHGKLERDKRRRE